jgi:signal transduction histidine kinase/CheY-like chemotaxis protein
LRDGGRTLPEQNDVPEYQDQSHRSGSSLRGDERLLTMAASAEAVGAIPLKSWRDAGKRAHFVQFYEEDRGLVDAVRGFTRRGLETGAGAVVIATPAHRESIERAWREEGFDPAPWRATGQLRELDAAATLERFMVRNRPDAARFRATVGAEIARSQREHGHVVAFGEMVALLWGQGHQGAAIQLEELWNELAKEHSFALFCAYPRAQCNGDAHAVPYHAVCSQHTGILTYDELAEKTAALEREIEARKRIEMALAAREQELREETHALEALNRLSRAVAAEVDFDSVVQLVIDETTALVGASYGAFFYNVIDEKGEKYRLHALSGAPRAAFEQFPSPRKTALFGPTFEGATVVRIDDVLADPRYGKSAPHHGMPPGHLPVRSYLAAAVNSPSGEVLGGLFFAHPQPGMFTERAERMVTGAAAHAAAAIERARLYKAAQTEIAERKRAEQALRESDRRKDEFLAILAHELRNPLAPIRYAIAIASKQHRTPEQRQWVDELVERQVGHMARLLDDLLDVSRITRGMLELRKARIDLTSPIATAIEAARPLIDGKKHALTIDLPKESVRLEADPVRLAQVFSNLLTNAAKYTDNGGRIELRAWTEGGHAVIAVRDSGIGIAPEMLPRLFTLFAQAKNALERSEGGLGIGLALVRGIVDLHGGAIEARSDGAGRGSEFIVRVPLGAGAPAELPFLASPDAAASGGERLRVVVADDNRDSAESCAAYLQVCGHEVHIAGTAREALDLVERLRPHVAVLDIGLPDFNGYTLAERVRAAPQGTEPVLIAVTGWGQHEDRQRAFAAGFDHHLTKPVSPGALEELLRGRNVT